MTLHSFSFQRYWCVSIYMFLAMVNHYGKFGLIAMVNWSFTELLLLADCGKQNAFGFVREYEDLLSC